MPIKPTFWPLTCVALGVNSNLSRVDWRFTTTVVFLPGRSLIVWANLVQSLVLTPATSTSWSPALIPAWWATELGCTLAIVLVMVLTPPWRTATKAKATIAKIKLLNGPAKLVSIRLTSGADWNCTSRGAIWTSVPSCSTKRASWSTS